MTPPRTPLEKLAAKWRESARNLDAMPKDDSPELDMGDCAAAVTYETCADELEAALASVEPGEDAEYSCGRRCNELGELYETCSPDGDGPEGVSMRQQESAQNKETPHNARMAGQRHAEQCDQQTVGVQGHGGKPQTVNAGDGQSGIAQTNTPRLVVQGAGSEPAESQPPPAARLETSKSDLKGVMPSGMHMRTNSTILPDSPSVDSVMTGGGAHSDDQHAPAARLDLDAIKTRAGSGYATTPQWKMRDDVWALVDELERLRVSPGAGDDCASCEALKLKLTAAEESVAGCARRVAELSAKLRAESQPPPAARLDPQLQLADAAERLWTVLANVSGGDWTKQSPQWQTAAAGARDEYFAVVEKLVGPPPEPSAPLGEQEKP